MGLRDYPQWVTFKNLSLISTELESLFLLSLFTVTATYSNLENHPRFLKLTQSKGTKKIHLDSKTGLPTVVEKGKEGKPKQSSDTEEDGSDDDEGEEDDTKPGKFPFLSLTIECLRSGI